MPNGSDTGDSHAVAISLSVTRRHGKADYPRACSRCGVVKPEADFGIDRAKRSGHKSHCRACEAAYYASRRDQLYARREAAREAEREAHLKELAVTHRKRVSAAAKAHADGVRRQKKLLLELGVPDLSPEEVTERASRPQAQGTRDARRVPQII